MRTWLLTLGAASALLLFALLVVITAGGGVPFLKRRNRFQEAMTRLPLLCGVRRVKYIGNNFCPPIASQQIIGKLQQYSPPVPGDYAMLPTPTIMGMIGTQAVLSRWLVDLGANPSSTDEEEFVDLWEAQYKGPVFDVPGNAGTMRAYYARFPRAIIDTDGTPPPGIVAKLQNYGVPLDLDLLKIDVDSFDCDFLQRILKAGYLPKLINMELAAPWPPPLQFMVEYTPNHPYDAGQGTAFGGCSLSMAAAILEPFGYALIQYPMEDGYFVKREFVGLFGDIESDLATAWDSGNPNHYADFAWLQDTTGFVGELKKLRGRPKEMLALAQKGGLDVMFDKRPSLRKAKYRLTV